MKKLLIVLMIVLVCASMQAQTVEKIEFINAELIDVIRSMGQIFGVSILWDETINGKTTYILREVQFKDAIDAFVKSNRLYYKVENNVYYLSRMDVVYYPGTNTVDLAADDVYLDFIIKKLMKETSKTILYDNLPNEKFTLNLKNQPLKSVLELLVKKYSNYSVEVTDNNFYIKKAATDYAASGTQPASKMVVKSGSLYDLNIEKGRFRELVELIFKLEGREFIYLTKNDLIIEALYLQDRTFAEALAAIMEQGSSDVLVKDDVSYIVEIQKQDVLNKYKQTEIINLKYLSVTDLITILPSDLASKSVFKVDAVTNTLILRGAAEELTPLKNFIEIADQPMAGKKYVRIDLNYILAKDLAALLPAGIGDKKPILLPGSNSVIMLLSEEREKEMRKYLAMIDNSPAIVPVMLRYSKAEDILKKIPSLFTKESFIETNDPNLILFTGSVEMKKKFLEYISLVDKPVPQIRYKVLVLEFTNDDGMTLAKNVKQYNEDTEEKIYEDGIANDSASKIITGAFGSLLNLNFDVVSVFGQQFAATFNLTLTEKHSRVMADTTLTGLSGQEIKFQNTTTFRIKEGEIDVDDETKTSAGVIKEISAGLIININGWISGDGMITMKVSATVSDHSSDSGANTTEKVVSTTIRSRSGTPLIISGLIQNKETKDQNKVPILGDIPFIKDFFNNSTSLSGNSEMAIYIIPYLEYPERTRMSFGEKAQILYEQVMDH